MRMLGIIMVSVALATMAGCASYQLSSKAKGAILE